MNIHERGTLLHQPDTPCVVIQSCHDEMVSLSACKLLKDRADLEDSTHYYYAPEDLEKILRGFSGFCDAWR